MHTKISCTLSNLSTYFQENETYKYNYHAYFECDPGYFVLPGARFTPPTYEQGFSYHCDGMFNWVPSVEDTANYDSVSKPAWYLEPGYEITCVKSASLYV